MTPFQKFLNGVTAAQMDMNEMLDELRGFAEIMARKQTTLDMDEDGTFYVTATGPLEEIIPAVERQLQKLKRISQERTNFR